jgi:curved DNA-binding protein CbpA
MDTIDDNELFKKMISKKNSTFDNTSKDSRDSRDSRDSKESRDFKESRDDNNIKRIEKNGFDYYKILGVDKDTSINDIKKKYRKLLAKYHPDKHKNLPEKERKTKEKQYQLVQMAGKVLTDEGAKKVFDLEQKTIKSKDFYSQKNSFEDFIKLQEAGMTEENKKRAQLDFDSEANKLNKLRGFDPDKMKDKLDKNELDKHIGDIRAQRDIDMIELAQRNLFEGRQFNSMEFNKLFEKDKKKQDKKLKKKQEAGELTKVGEDFTAFNDNGIENFISVDDDYGELFGKDNFKENNMYGKMKDNLSVSDISSDDDEYNNDYENHNKNRDTKSTDDLLQRMMRDRGDFDTRLKDTKTAGYKDVMEDQFGISRQFGRMLGHDVTQKIKPQKLDSDMVNVYNKMIGYDSDTSDEE